MSWLPRPKSSLRLRLPLLMAGLVLVALLLSTALAHDQLENVLLREEGGRMRAVLQLLVTSTSGNADRYRALIDRLAARAEIVGALSGEGSRDGAEGVLLDHAVENGEVVAVALVDTAGRCVVAIARPASGPDGEETEPEPERTACEGRAETGGDSRPPEGVRPLAERRGSLFIEVASPVRHEGTTVGYVVEGRAGSDRSGAELAERLISRDATIFALNADGGFWTDFERGVPAVLDSVEVERLTEYEDSSGEERLGIGMEVPGTPWLLWLQRDRDIVVGPAAAVVRRNGIVLLGVLLAALLAAAIMSTRLTRPLQHLALAAEAVAAGEFGRRVQVDRDDELGRLGAAFNEMASEIELSHGRLEARVSERTEELARALDDLQEAQTQLLRKERLAVMGALAGGVAHELRTPLTVLENAVYVIEQEVGEPSERLSEYLEICRGQIALSERIIGDLLDFARRDASRTRPVRVAGLVDAQLGRLSSAPGVEVVREIPDDLPEVEVDPVQMGQVLFNLLTNACEALGPEGGTVTVRASPGREGGVLLEVADTGMGIPKERQAEIFKPLYTTKPHGFGFGLSVSRELAAANEVEIRVRSTPGEGTVMTLDLPAAPSRSGEGA